MFRISASCISLLSFFTSGTMVLAAIHQPLPALGCSVALARKCRRVERPTVADVTEKCWVYHPLMVLTTRYSAPHTRLVIKTAFFPFTIKEPVSLSKRFFNWSRDPCMIRTNNWVNFPPKIKKKTWWKLFFIYLSAGPDSADGGKLPSVVPQGSSAGVQRGIHEGN